MVDKLDVHLISAMYFIIIFIASGGFNVRALPKIVKKKIES